MHKNAYDKFNSEPFYVISGSQKSITNFWTGDSTFTQIAWS